MPQSKANKLAETINDLDTLAYELRMKNEWRWHAKVEKIKENLLTELNKLFAETRKFKFPE